MNIEASFSTVRSNLEIVLRLHTSGLCECRRKDLRQFEIERHLPLPVPVEAGSRDDLRIPGPECSFFFIVLPPVNVNGFFTLFHCR